MLKDILVYVGTDADNRSRISTAAMLTAQYDAHLSGLYVDDWAYRISMLAPEMVPMLINEQKAVWDAQKHKAIRQFNSIVQKSNLIADCATEEGSISDQVNRYARVNDLVIASLHDYSNEGYMMTDVIHHLALESGAPILALPKGFILSSEIQKIAVAWNGSRESARAVRDAMPLLVKADYVEVLIVEDSSDSADESGVQREALCEHLSHHDVTVGSTTLDASKRHAGDTLIEHIASNHHDLLVMGAYGHSRFRETILGGVTKHIINHTSIPLLLSH